MSLARISGFLNSDRLVTRVDQLLAEYNHDANVNKTDVVKKVFEKMRSEMLADFQVIASLAIGFHVNQLLLKAASPKAVTLSNLDPLLSALPKILNLVHLYAQNQFQLMLLQDQNYVPSVFCPPVTGLSYGVSAGIGICLYTLLKPQIYRGLTYKVTSAQLFLTAKVDQQRTFLSLPVKKPEYAVVIDALLENDANAQFEEYMPGIFVPVAFLYLCDSEWEGVRLEAFFYSTWKYHSMKSQPKCPDSESIFISRKSTAIRMQVIANRLLCNQPHCDLQKFLGQMNAKS